MPRDITRMLEVKKMSERADAQYFELFDLLISGEVELVGNNLTGKTFGVKESIKMNYEGRWNGQDKCWSISDKNKDGLLFDLFVVKYEIENPKPSIDGLGEWAKNRDEAVAKFREEH